jgi:hypothetical protein
VFVATIAVEAASALMLRQHSLLEFQWKNVGGFGNGRNSPYQQITDYERTMNGGNP